jgi:hypothetical protein
MKTSFPSSLLLAAFVATFWFGPTHAQTIRLEPGVGVRQEELIIGQVEVESTVAEGESRALLNYEVDDMGRVILIRCSDHRCATTEGVSIGVPKAVVRSRYGTPKSRVSNAGFELYHYAGVSFKFENDVVSEIYIISR